MKPFTCILVLFGSIVAYQAFAANNRPAPQPKEIETTIVPSVPPQPAAILTACELATKEFKNQDAANWEFAKELERLTPEEKARTDRQALKSTIDSRIMELEMAKTKMKYDCTR
jgi:hypothetical protein